MKTRLRLILAFGLAVALLPTTLGAHERFVKHELLNHLKDAFFMQQTGMPFGMDPNMIQVGLLVSLVLAAFFVFYFLREGLDEILRYKVLASLRGSVQRSNPNHSGHSQVRSGQRKYHRNRA